MAACGTVGPKLAVRRDVLRLLLDHLQPEIERRAAIFQQKHLAAIGNQNGRATGYPHRLLLIIGSLLKAPLLTTLWRGARCTLHPGPASGHRHRPCTTYAPYGPTRLHSTPRSRGGRSEEHTSELQSLMRISYAVFCLKKKKNT